MGGVDGCWGELVLGWDGGGEEAGGKRQRVQRWGVTARCPGLIQRQRIRALGRGVLRQGEWWFRSHRERRLGIL